MLKQSFIVNTKEVNNLNRSKTKKSPGRYDAHFSAGKHTLKACQVSCSFCSSSVCSCFRQLTRMRLSILPYSVNTPRCFHRCKHIACPPKRHTLSCLRTPAMHRSISLHLSLVATSCVNLQTRTRHDKEE